MMQLDLKFDAEQIEMLESDEIPGLHEVKSAYYVYLQDDDDFLDKQIKIKLRRSKEKEKSRKLRNNVTKGKGKGKSAVSKREKGRLCGLNCRQRDWLDCFSRYDADKVEKEEEEKEPCPLFAHHSAKSASGWPSSLKMAARSKKERNRGKKLESKKEKLRKVKGKSRKIRRVVQTIQRAAKNNLILPQRERKPCRPELQRCDWLVCFGKYQEAAEEEEVDEMEEEWEGSNPPCSALSAAGPPQPDPPPYSREVAAASKWWADTLRARCLDAPALATARAFEGALARAMERHFAGHWYPDDPPRGSAYRSILRDRATVDPMLRAAAAAAAAATAAAGIDDMPALLPRAVMWVNPGAVRVRVAGRRAAQAIFPPPAAAAT